MALFDLRDETVRYNGKAVLKGVSLKIERGEKVALVGRSGAGKSTLLTLLHSQHPEKAALVPHDGGLVKTLSVFHNIYMGRLEANPTWYNLVNLAWPMRREIEAIQPIVADLGLADKLMQPAGELSGGQQQRTAVARALYHDGEVLLGDEPVSAVDEHQARAVLDTIAAAHDTMVLAMHDVDLALAYCGRIVGIQDGRIVFDEPAADLTRQDLAPLYIGEA